MFDLSELRAAVVTNPVTVRILLSLCAIFLNLFLTTFQHLAMFKLFTLVFRLAKSDSDANVNVSMPLQLSSLTSLHSLMIDPIQLLCLHQNVHTT